MHDLFLLQEYRDFAENLGRYKPGESGVLIPDVNGVSTHKIPYPVPDMGAVVTQGYATLYSPSYLTSVKHNGGYTSVDFGNNAKYKTTYNLINRNEHDTKDFHLPRLNKVVTEAAPLPRVDNGSDLEREPDRYTFYARVGGGKQLQLDPVTGEGKLITGAYEWKTGGTFNKIIFEKGQLRWFLHGPGDTDVAPLEIGIQPGDSGSPMLVFDAVDKVWKLAGIITAFAGAGYNQSSYALFLQSEFAHNVIAANVSPDVTDTRSGGIIRWLKDKISQGGNNWTWKGLDEKYSDVAPSLATNKELDATKDLRFNGAGGTILLDKSVNMGAGKLQFSADYIVKPGDNPSATWAGGGIEVDNGHSVKWGVNGVKDDALHKIGQGTLWVNATGINQGSLNTGDGIVVLDQQPDMAGNKQAFSSITLVSGRPTVILNDANQVSTGNINFGYRGGILDLNGNSLSFKEINHTDNGATLVNNNLSTPSTLELTGYSDDDRSRQVFRGFIGSRDLAKTQGKLNVKIDMFDNTSSVMALTGGANITGEMDVKKGTLLLSGQPVPHAGGVVFDNDWYTSVFNAQNINVETGATLQVGTFAMVNADINAASGARVLLGYSDGQEGRSPVWRCYALINTSDNTCSQAPLSQTLVDSMPESLVEGDIVLGPNAHLQLGKVFWKGKVTGQEKSSVSLEKTAHWQMSDNSSVSVMNISPGGKISFLPDDEKNWKPKLLRVDDMNSTGGTVALGLDVASSESDTLVINNSTKGGDNILSINISGNPSAVTSLKNKVVIADAPAGTDHSYFKLASLSKGFTIYTPDYNVQDVDGRVKWILKDESWLLASDNNSLIRDTRALMSSRSYLLDKSSDTLNNRISQLRSDDTKDGAWASLDHSRALYGPANITRSVLSTGMDKQIDHRFYGLTADITQGHVKGVGSESHALYSLGAYYGGNVNGLNIDISGRYMYLDQSISPLPAPGNHNKKSNIVTGRIRAGYPYYFAQREMTVTPYMELRGDIVSGYSMQGKNARIALSSGTPLFLTSGVKVDKNLSDSPLTLTGDIAWQYHPGDGGAKLTLADSHKQRRYKDASPHTARAGLGLRGQITQALTAGIQMSYDHGGYFTDEMTASAGVQYQFR